MNCETVANSSRRRAGAGERIAFICAGSATLYFGLRRRGPIGWVAATMGGHLLYHGAFGCSPWRHAIERGPGTGRRASVKYETGIRVDQSITIDRPRGEIYRFWRRLENLPQFMNHVRSVERVDDRRSHWSAKAPAGMTVEWDAEVINEIADELIGWRSLPGADVDNAGSVRFEVAPDDRGTEVIVSLQYYPPAGELGYAVARMLGTDPTRQLRADLHRLKRLMESGEAADRESMRRAASL